MCEYNATTQGLLITEPNMLINRSWEDIKDPTTFISRSAYLTALTYTDKGETIQILDIEKILGEIIGVDETMSEEILKEAEEEDLKKHNIFVVDDSRAARTLIATVLEKIGVSYTLFESAVAAYEKLLEMAKDDKPIYEHLSMIISDIEMPSMDGFTFTKNIRSNPKLADLYVVLHSSMSNESNLKKAKQLGADDFIPKFQVDNIANIVLNKVRNKK
ncbi:Response regulator receiver modulated CheW protein [Candidatus Magnetoovum chiemensis]|nr:Response regulator receiver modulated CheW protein [Candidatus Magnetoovum chiemensis]